jgi:ABC-type sugar transport system ATPase subunit
MSEYILETKGITKTFPGVKALNCINLKVKKGEVHALVGENGAGKSTLMLTLAGIYKPDEGEIFIEGNKVSLDSALDANSKGISVVYQELSLIPNLSIAENIFANRQPVNSFGMIDYNKLALQTREMLALFNIDFIDPFTLVKDLSIANQQIIEILKAISYNPKVLILDEPTSSLTDGEIKQLFKNIRILKEKGITFIYISHHLQEIFEIADTVSILRDGEHVCDANVKDIEEDFLVTKMVGRKIENIYGSRDNESKKHDVLFEVKHLNKKGTFEDINFNVRAGEILGFAGLIGAGRSEVFRSIFGADKYNSGELYLSGKKITPKNPNESIKAGIGYLPEDRKNMGLYLKFGVDQNLISNHLKDFADGMFIRQKLIDSYANKSINSFEISTTNSSQTVGKLSGGNQQKVLVATWFGINPKVLIVDEPTKGVDVGAKSEIYTFIRETAKRGTAVIVISSDLPEVIGISDRIIVMKDGRIAGEISKEIANEQNVIAMATGVAIN